MYTSSLATASSSKSLDNTFSLNSFKAFISDSLAQEIDALLAKGLKTGDVKLATTTDATTATTTDATTATTTDATTDATTKKRTSYGKHPKVEVLKDTAVSYKVIATKGASVATAGKTFYSIVCKEDLRGATRKYVNRVIGASAPEKRKVEIFGGEYVWGVFPTKKAATETMAVLPKEIKAADIEAFINRGWTLA